jgi:hypothetical protein
LESLVETLMSDPTYKFNWCEVSYLHRWWQESASSELKKNFKTLVANGQIYFVGGGFIANDEATVQYFEEMEQLEAGLKFLKETFG